MTSSGLAIDGLVPPAEPSTERGRRTRDALVASAREVFEQRGFAGTRMSDVATAAGTSHGTVYTWFPSKEHLLRHVVDDVVREVFEASGPTSRRPDRAHSALEAWLRLLAANTRFLDTYGRQARMLAVVEEAASVDISWAVAVDGLRQAYVDRTARTLRRLQSDGLVAADLHVDSAAVALTGMVETYARRVVGVTVTDSVPATQPDPLTPADPTLAGHAERITRLWARAVGLAVPVTEETS